MSGLYCVYAYGVSYVWCVLCGVRVVCVVRVVCYVCVVITIFFHATKWWRNASIPSFHVCHFFGMKFFIPLMSAHLMVSPITSSSLRVCVCVCVCAWVCAYLICLGVLE